MIREILPTDLEAYSRAFQCLETRLTLDESREAFGLAYAQGYRLWGWFQGECLGVIGYTEVRDPTIKGVAFRVNSLYVKESERSKSNRIGWKLAKHVERLAIESGAFALLTEVALENSKLARVYERAGFRKTAYYLYREL